MSVEQVVVRCLCCPHNKKLMGKELVVASSSFVGSSTNMGGATLHHSFVHRIWRSLLDRSMGRSFITENG